ncbi:hypothetical protein HOK51_04355 [Candidatus Woesearchaeota archaeon]|jgi:hypoxanthine phosphoribosyltransferase|nr:hypothetical protein [Candidatus Woesearchaeota archaeon]MBT6519055.1 hypothetical protein [Candidatus Woesearchaeota archaeon]MBT7367324.1 hypothetical protein [Candidatus Woesearchaeota archaeon]
MNIIDELSTLRTDYAGEMPEWFDTTLLDLFHKKKTRSDMKKRERTLDAALRGMLKAVPDEFMNTHKHSWIDVEGMIRESAFEIDACGYKPDVVIGIKSGGALIAKYVGDCLGVECVDYMKVSHYSDKSRSVAKSLTEASKDAKVTEEVNECVFGKKILLVDDQSATGASIVAAENYLISLSALEVKSFCLFSRGSELVDYYSRECLAVYFPWGKDA